MAANSCSSPAYIVSTTMPRSGRSPAQRPHQVEAGAVGQPDVGHDHVGRDLRGPAASASATEPAWPDDLEVGVRSNAPPAPAGSARGRRPAGPWSWARRRLASSVELPESSRADLVPRSAPVRVSTVQLGADALGALAHDLKPWESCRARCRPAPSSRTSISAYGGRTVQLTHRFWRSGVLAGVGDRLLGDPQQLGLDVAAQPGAPSSRVTCTVRSGARADLAAYAGDSRPRPCAGGDLVAQVEDRVPQLG